MANTRYVSFNVAFDPDFVSVSAMQSALNHLGDEFEEFVLSFDTEEEEDYGTLA